MGGGAHCLATPYSGGALSVALFLHLTRRPLETRDSGGRCYVRLRLRGPSGIVTPDGARSRSAYGALLLEWSQASRSGAGRRIRRAPSACAVLPASIVHKRELDLTGRHRPGRADEGSPDP